MSRFHEGTNLFNFGEKVKIMKLISIVLSLYNEESGIPSFWETLLFELKKISDFKFEIIWVNDGSIDKTQEKIEQVCYPKVESINHVLIQFSRNYGHEAAMIAGIDNASGDAVICMDADAQHPASQIKHMLNAFGNGYNIVLMQRTEREDNGMLKRFLSSFFYTAINKLSSIKFQKNASDFFLISKNVAEIFKSEYRDNNRFIRGFIQEVGFSKVVLDYVAPPREYGESSYSFGKLIKLAIDVIFSFSNKPLRLVMLISVCFFLFTFIFGIYSLVQFFIEDSIPSGYTSIIFFNSFSFSLIFLVLTILSVYFERTLKEIKNRPIYIIKELKHQ